MIDRRSSLSSAVLLGGLLFASAGDAQLGGAAGVVIPYAGQLQLDGEPVHSPTPVSFRFTLWDLAEGGTACPDQYVASSPVRGGRFQVEIGPVAESCVLGKQVFLSLEVDQSGSYVALDGRQRVHPSLGAVTSGPADFGVPGQLRVGSPTSLNVAVDNDEIAARNNSGSATLHLNNEGGDVVIGDATSTVTVRGTLRAPQIFGAPGARSPDTDYVAESDGFVNAHMTAAFLCGNYGTMTGLVDGAPRSLASAGSACFGVDNAQNTQSSFLMPVRKGETYRVEVVPAGSVNIDATVTFFPLGS